MRKALCVITLVLALPVAASGKGGPKPVKYAAPSAPMNPKLLKPESAMTAKQKQAFGKAVAAAKKLAGPASALQASALVLRAFHTIKLAQQQAGINVLTGLP